MTKREAALQLLGLALDIHRKAAGDEDADAWVLRVLWLAADLDRNIIAHPRYLEALSHDESLQVKLKRLIDHPATPAFERTAALAALQRVREREL